MKTAFEKLLEKAPWLVRWVFYVFWTGAVFLSSIFVFGWDARDFADKHVYAIAEDVFETKAAPLKAKRDAEFFALKEDLGNIRSEMQTHGRVLYRIEGKLDKGLANNP